MLGAAQLRCDGLTLLCCCTAINRYGIDMTSEFRTQGATQFGTISKSRFNSIITITFGNEKDFKWDEDKIKTLNEHYGTGALDLALGGRKQVAWMDVCEDLGEVDARFCQALTQRP